MNTLGEEYPKEQARCRALLGHYIEIGPAGAFGRLMISQVLERADKAAIEQDLQAMLHAFQEMKGCN